MKLWLSEYCSLVTLPNHAGQAPIEPVLAEQLLDFSGGPAVSNPLSQYTRLIRLVCDASCSVSIGVNPNATIANGRLPADAVEYRGTPEGQSFRFSVIGNT